MRRFLLFPPLWSCLFFAAQVTIELINRISFWLRLHFQPPTDFYLHINSKSSLFRFVPGIVIGLGVGIMFAALDLYLDHRSDARGEETLKRLLKYLFQSLVAAMLFIIILTGIKDFILMSYGMHRRYHAYPPNLQLLNALSLVPFVVLAGAFLWSMSKSLRHRL